MRSKLIFAVVAMGWWAIVADAAELLQGVRAEWGVAVVGDGVLGTADNANVVYCQMTPWQFDSDKGQNQKRTFRRAAFLVSRLLGNMGVGAVTPLVEPFSKPASADPRRRRRGGRRGCIRIVRSNGITRIDFSGGNVCAEDFGLRGS